MPWSIFTGDGQPRQPSAVDTDDPDEGRPAPRIPAWRAIPPPPPWRRGASTDGPPPFRTTPELVRAVNAALHLRRPLLLTGPPGSGKSSVIDLIAAELELGEVLRWHVTSKSALTDALYQYDALGRLQATQIADGYRAPADRQSTGRGGADEARVENYVTLGPLGTALASPDRPRAVLIDELDKSDLDLPGDLLNVLERGEFDIPPLVRAATGRSDEAATASHTVRGADREQYTVDGGVVETHQFPVIVFTSNGERMFPPPFLRRCIQFNMPKPNADFLAEIVTAHLGAEAAERERVTIEEFARGLDANRNLAIDQLLNIVYLATGEAAPGSADRTNLESLVLAELTKR